ncbi:hypothetical protein OAU50_03000 [Planctomycetota bacterium]|nr:hypothetical protein [Planctomycetota bacterium]
MKISLALSFVMLLLAGCGSMPKPKIDFQKPRADATYVRVSMVPTNHDSSWKNEKLRLRCSQIWLNDDGVPTNKEVVFDTPYGGDNGAMRYSLKMRDSEGDSTTDVRLQFELVNGENENENVSAGTTLDWDVPSSLAGKDIVFTAYVSRSGRNNYALDVLYASDPTNAERVQVLPSDDES